MPRTMFIDEREITIIEIGAGRWEVFEGTNPIGHVWRERVHISDLTIINRKPDDDEVDVKIDRWKATGGRKDGSRTRRRAIEELLTLAAEREEEGSSSIRMQNGVDG